jgi:hypothetical protein
MDLLNRYLHAVKFLLPKAQQEDIVAELGEDLRAQIDEREAALGRPLDDDSVAAILKQRGHPMLVAAHYLPQRSLIGPAVFPIYQFILKLVALWILLPVFILVVGPATILSSRQPSLALIETVWTLLMAAVFAFGVITLIFAILERYPSETTFKWNPRRLPRVPQARAAAAPQLVSAVTAFGEVMAGTLASLLWIDLMWFPKSLDVNGVLIAPTPIWHSFFWPILLVMLGRATAGLIAWLRPWWTRARLSLVLAIDAVTLVLIGALINMGPWVRLAAPDLPASAVANATHWANTGMSIGFSAGFIITVVDTVREVRRLWRTL